GDHRCKDHGVAQVLIPVLRVESGTVHRNEGRYGPRRPFGGGRHRGVEGNVTRTRSDPGKDLQEPVPNPVDGKGVRTVVETEVTYPYTVLFAGDDKLRDRVSVTGDDRCVRSVHPGHHELPLPGGDEFRQTFVTDPDGRHATVSGHVPEESTAERDDPGAVLQRQHPRHARRGDLPLGVPHHGGGFDPGGTPQFRQRHHDCPQHRLHHVHAG